MYGVCFVLVIVLARHERTGIDSKPPLSPSVRGNKSLTMSRPSLSLFLSLSLLPCRTTVPLADLGPLYYK